MIVYLSRSITAYNVSMRDGRTTCHFSGFRYYIYCNKIKNRELDYNFLHMEELQKEIFKN